jgi:hypothetical protein
MTQHPFELFMADYLSIPIGTGGFHTIALVMDTFTCFHWGLKLKTKGTKKTTWAALQSICNAFDSPGRLMVDGGSHFDCGPVWEFCKEEGIELQIVSPYSLWIAGLIENRNNNLLSVLGRMTTIRCNGRTYKRTGQYTSNMQSTYLTDI